MNKPTPGPWTATPSYINLGEWEIYGNEDGDNAQHIGSIEAEGTEQAEANAALIVAAVNSCFAVNPDNPLAVAEALREIVDIVRGFVFISDNEKRDPCESNRNAKTILIEQARAALAKLEAKP